MRSIAGLLTPKSGTIRLDGRVITRVREVGRVFQSYALFAHLTVFENVAFGLRLRREPDLAAKVAARAPAALSGGQEQRAALAWRPGWVTLGSGPCSGVIRGAAFAGAHREYALDTPLGVAKVEIPASAPPRAPGSEVAFDLPPARAVRLSRAA